MPVSGGSDLAIGNLLKYSGNRVPEPGLPHISPARLLLELSFSTSVVRAALGLARSSLEACRPQVPIQTEAPTSLVKAPQLIPNLNLGLEALNSEHPLPRTPSERLAVVVHHSAGDGTQRLFLRESQRLAAGRLCPSTKHMMDLVKQLLTPLPIQKNTSRR